MSRQLSLLATRRRTGYHPVTQQADIGRTGTVFRETAVGRPAGP
jgi:hypothetical protein